MKAKAMKKTLSCILALTLTASMMSESLTSFAALDENTAQTAEAPEAPEEDGVYFNDADLAQTASLTLAPTTSGELQQDLFNDDEWDRVKDTIVANNHWSLTIVDGTASNLATLSLNNIDDGKVKYEFGYGTSYLSVTPVADKATWESIRGSIGLTNNLYFRAEIEYDKNGNGTIENTEKFQASWVQITVAPDAAKTISGKQVTTTDLSSKTYYAGQTFEDILKDVKVRYELNNTRIGKNGGVFTDIPVLIVDTPATSTSAAVYKLNTEYIASLKIGETGEAPTTITSVTSAADLATALATPLVAGKTYTVDEITLVADSTANDGTTVTATVAADAVKTLTLDSAAGTGSGTGGRPTATEVEQNKELDLTGLRIKATMQSGNTVLIAGFTTGTAPSTVMHVSKSDANATEYYTTDGTKDIDKATATYTTVDTAKAATAPNSLNSDAGKWTVVLDTSKVANNQTAYFVYAGQAVAIEGLSVTAGTITALAWAQDIDTVLAPGATVAFQKGEILCTATFNNGKTTVYDPAVDTGMFKIEPTKVDINDKETYDATTNKAKVKISFLGNGKAYGSGVQEADKSFTVEVPVQGTATTLTPSTTTAAKAVYPIGTDITEIDTAGISITFTQTGATSVTKTYNLSELIKDSKFDVTLDATKVTTSDTTVVAGKELIGQSGKYHTGGGGKITIKYEGDPDKGIASAELALYVQIVSDVIDTVTLTEPTVKEYAVSYEGYTGALTPVADDDLYAGASIEITTKGGKTTKYDFDMNKFAVAGNVLTATIDGVGTLTITEPGADLTKGKNTFNVALYETSTGTTFTSSFDITGIEATITSIAPYAGELIGTKDAINSASKAAEGDTTKIPVTSFKAGTAITQAGMKGTNSGSLVVNFSDGKKQLVLFTDSAITISDDVDYETAGASSVLVTYTTNKDTKDEKSYNVEVPITFTENSVNTLKNLTKSFTTKFYTGDKELKFDKDKDKFTVDLVRADGTTYKAGVDVIAGLAAGDFEITGFKEGVTDATTAAKNVKLKLIYLGLYADETKAPEAEFTIDVEAEDYDLSISGLKKTKYGKGEAFTNEGGIIKKDFRGQTPDVETDITAAADAGYTVKIVDSSNKEVADFTKAPAGTYKLVVTETANEKKTASTEITIANKYATAIKLTAPKKTQYYSDGTAQKIDWTDFNLEITWSDGTTDTEIKQSSGKIKSITATYIDPKTGEKKDYPQTAKNYSDFASIVLQLGVSTFTVAVDDQTATFTINTDELTLKSVTAGDGVIKVGDTVAEKVTVDTKYLGEQLVAADFTAGELIVETNDGTKKRVKIVTGGKFTDGVSVTGYDPAKEGTQTVKVNYTYTTKISKKTVTIGANVAIKVEKDVVESVGLYTSDTGSTAFDTLAANIGDTWANVPFTGTPCYAIITYASGAEKVINLSDKNNRSLFTPKKFDTSAVLTATTTTLTYNGGKDKFGEAPTVDLKYTVAVNTVTVAWTQDASSNDIKPTTTIYSIGTTEKPLKASDISAAGGKLTLTYSTGSKAGSTETVDLATTKDFGWTITGPNPSSSTIAGNFATAGEYTATVTLTATGGAKYSVSPSLNWTFDVEALATYASAIDVKTYPSIDGKQAGHPAVEFNTSKNAYVIKAMTYSSADEFIAELADNSRDDATIGRTKGAVTVTMSDAAASKTIVAIANGGTNTATLDKGTLNTAKAGEYQINVKYQNQTKPIKVIVEENAVKTIEAFNTSAGRTDFGVGQAFDATNWTMTVTLESGKRTAGIDLASLIKAGTVTVSELNTNGKINTTTTETVKYVPNAASQDLKFTYGTASATETVAVKETTLVGIALAKAPTKTVYKFGETVDPADFDLLGVYSYDDAGSTRHYFTKKIDSADVEFVGKLDGSAWTVGTNVLGLALKADTRKLTDTNKRAVFALNNVVTASNDTTSAYSLTTVNFTVQSRTPNTLTIKEEPTKVFWKEYKTANKKTQLVKADEFKVKDAKGSVIVDYKDSAETTEVKFTSLTTSGAFTGVVGDKDLATPADVLDILATAGTKTVDLVYTEDGNATYAYTSYDFEVKDDSVTGFKIVEPEVIPTYTKGDAVNLTGYYAEFTMASGREAKKVSLANNPDFTVSKIDTTLPAGKQTITVKYAGGQSDAEKALTATFDVSVSDNAVVGMKFTKQPTKSLDSYTTIDEAVVIDGAEIEVTYRNEFTLEDGTTTKTEKITLPNEAVQLDYSKVDFTKVGDYKASLIYKDFEFQFVVNVTEAIVESIAADLDDAEDPIVVLYKVDATGKTKFATETGHINVTYKQKDAEGKNVVKKVALKDIDEAAITGFDATKVTKDGKVTVTYKKATCTIAYTVTDTTVQAIKVEPAAFTFKTGETVDYLTKATAGITYEGEDKITTGTLAELQTANKIKIAITDADGKPATIDNTKAGVYTVTITSAEDPASKASATVTVTITAISLESFTASKNKISLKTTDTLATVLPTLTDFNFTAVYSDGTKKVYNLVADFDNLLLDLENVKWGVEGSYTATVGLKADQSKTATVTIEIKDNNKIDDQTVEDIPEEVPTKEDAVVVFTKSGSEWTEGNGYATLTAALDAKTGMGKATGDLMFVISKDITEAKALKFPAKATSITIVGDGTLTLSKATTIKAAAVNIDAKINGVLNVTAIKGGTITIGDKTGTLGKVTGDKSSSKLNVLGSVTMAGLTGFASVYAEDGAIITMGAKGNVANVGKLDAEIKFTDAASTVSNVTVDEGIFHLAQAGAKVTKVTLAAAPTKFLDIIVGTEETTLAGGETVLYGTGKADVSANVVIRNKDANGNVLGAVPYNKNKEVRAENCELIDYTIGVGGEVLHTSSFEALFNKLANESGLVEVSLNGDAKWGSKLTIPKGLTSLNIIGNDNTITVEATAIKGGNCSLVFEDVKLDAKNAKGAIALTISTNGSLMSFKDSVVLGKTVTLSGNKKNTTLTLDGLNAVDNIQNFANVIVEADGGAAKKKFTATKVTLADGMLAFDDGATVTIDALEGTGSLGLTKPTKKFKAITLKGATIANEGDIKLLTIAFEGNPTYAVLNTPGFAAGTQIFADKSKGAVDYTKFDATGLIENGGLQNVKGKVTLGVKN